MTEHKLMEHVNAKALKWIRGNMNYIDSVLRTNLLPPLFLKGSPGLFGVQ